MWNDSGRRNALYSVDEAYAGTADLKEMKFLVNVKKFMMKHPEGLRSCIKEADALRRAILTGSPRSTRVKAADELLIALGNGADGNAYADWTELAKESIEGRGLDDGSVKRVREKRENMRLKHEFGINEDLTKDAVTCTSRRGIVVYRILKGWMKMFGNKKTQQTELTLEQKLELYRSRLILTGDEIREVEKHIRELVQEGKNADKLQQRINGVKYSGLVRRKQQLENRFSEMEKIIRNLNYEIELREEEKELISQEEKNSSADEVAQLADRVDIKREERKREIDTVTDIRNERTYEEFESDPENIEYMRLVENAKRQDMSENESKPVTAE